MAATLKELQEKRMKLGVEIRGMADEFNKGGQKWKDEETRKKWETVNGDYDATMRDISEAQSAKDVEARLNAIHADDERSSFNPGERIPGREDTNPSKRSRDPKEHNARSQESRALALVGWCRHQLGENLTREMREACRAVRLNPSAKQLRLHMPDTRKYRDLQAVYRNTHPNFVQDKIAESRALSAYTVGSGGILAPDSFVQNLEVNMLAFGGMRQVAETMVTGRGEDIVWPTADDTSNEGQQLGESASIGSSTDPSFSAVTWGAYKFSSKPVLVPFELLEDNVFDLPSVLSGMLGERLGRVTNRKYTTGSGANEPKGIVTAATLGKTTAGAAAITINEVLDLVHSVDPAYRNGASFMFHDNILLYLRKLQDLEGRPLWQQGINGAPDTLWSYRYTINQSMASSVATTNKTMLFGQLSKYKIRRVNQIRMYRLEERYRDNDQDGFVALLREDGNLLTAGTAPVKYMQQA